MDADRLTRFNRADIGEIRLDPYDLTEMHPSAAAMGNKLPETQMARKAGHRIMAGRDRANVAAMRDGIFRIGIAGGKPGHLGKLGRQHGHLRHFFRHVWRASAQVGDQFDPPRTLMALLSEDSLSRISELMLSKARFTWMSWVISLRPLTLEFSR